MPFCGRDRLLLAQHQIHDPATTNMLPCLAAVTKDVGVLAPRFFQGVGKGCDHMGVVRSLVEDRSPIREEVLAFLKKLEDKGK